MKIIRQKKDLLNFINRVRNISFVPTMGSLHKGHLKLIKMAKKKSNFVIVSIFINPKQFNSKRDFTTYPRTIKKDIELLKKLKVNCLFKPNYKDIFNFKTKKKVYIHPFSQKLCGKFRPGHFKGVVNVINRFLEIIKPKYIFLGKKDFQQLILIRKHIFKRKIKTIVIECNTIRFKKYLPFSSRNMNLTNNEKNFAIKVFKIIKFEKIKIKNKRLNKINLSGLKKKIKSIGVKKIEYIEAINLINLKKAKKYNENFNIFTAIYINKIRLIDNF